MSNALTLSVGDTPDSGITFISKDEWIMKIERGEKGSVILFNTETFPDCMPDDFAKSVCEILCKSGYLDNIYNEVKRTLEKKQTFVTMDSLT